MSNPTLASITAELEAVETAARGRGSLTCDHLAGRIANIRGELQQIAQPQPPAEAQAQGGGEVRAKPIEWMEDGGDWCDRHHGFQITRDEDWPQENSFIAAWGEGDAERFATLEEAQGWCQEAIDRYVREWAVAAPPSAPVGVEVASLPALWRMREDNGEEHTEFDSGYEQASHECADALERALAQQPAAVDGAAQAMAEIGRLIATQDNRITESPIFIVQQKRTYVSEPGYNEDRVQWVTDDDDHRVASGEDVERNERYFDEHQLEPSGWRRMHVHDVWEFVTACYTEQGCKDYIARDGHNLREPRIYAAGSYRNAEWQAVRSYLMALAGQQGGES